MFLPPVESSFYRPAHRYCVINFKKNCHFTVHVRVELTSFWNRLVPNEEKKSLVQMTFRWTRFFFFPDTRKHSKYFRRIMGAHLAVKWSRLQGRNSFIYSRGLRSFVSITFFSFSLRNESLHENILFHIIVSEGWNIFLRHSMGVAMDQKWC